MRFPAKVLLATDGSDDAAAATWAATDLADRSGARLHVAHVFEFVPPREFMGVALRLKSHLLAPESRGREVLEEQVGLVEEAGGKVAGAHLTTGSPVEGILRTHEEIGADLVVVGSRGLGGVKRLLLGSVSEGVVHHARCPVLVLRPGNEAWPPAHILVADDGSGYARRAGKVAAAIGSLFSARMTLAQVYPRLLESQRSGETPEGHMVREAIRRVRERVEERALALEPILGSRPAVAMLADEGSEDIGGVAMTLLDAAADISAEPALISLGARGLGTASRMQMGSVSAKVVRAAPGPVLVCPRPRGQ